MEVSFNHFTDQTGKKVIVQDSTLWGEGDNPSRSDYAILVSVVKFKRGSENYFLKPSTGYSSLSYSDSYDDEYRATFKFDLLEDGYHIISFTPIVADDSSSEEDGSLYYDSIFGLLMVRQEGEWVEIDQEDIFKSSNQDMVKTKVGVNPFLEKTLDKIWKRYEADAFPKDGKDYKNFYLGYGMLIGAVSTMKQGSFEEYDRKMDLANKLAKKWK